MTMLQFFAIMGAVSISLLLAVALFKWLGWWR